MAVRFEYDAPAIDEIAARFDLRSPNASALHAVAEKIADRMGPGGAVTGSTATGGDRDYPELIADLATGVGKTYLMASLVEYAAQQGVRHVLVVTPNTTIQDKTIANFDAASAKYVTGADIAPFVVTPENFRTGQTGAVLRDPRRLKVFVFNVQQLLQPTAKATRKTRTPDEVLGQALYDHLRSARDLLIISDEHHVYHERAKAFSGAVRNLAPFALVGLTATPDPSDVGKIVFQYTLGEAIADEHVKIPVIVYRQAGTKDQGTQLADACALLAVKESAYTQYAKSHTVDDAPHPVLFIVASSIEHAEEVSDTLAETGYLGDPGKVLTITSQSSDEALQALEDVESPTSPVRVIVSVNKLREGWDVKNIAVIAALRRLASQTLTEQVLGRGLRLPFGKRTGVPDVDQVDLVAHDSYQQLLEQKGVLASRVNAPSNVIATDETGTAIDTEMSREEQDAADQRPHGADLTPDQSEHTGTGPQPGGPGTAAPNDRGGPGQAATQGGPGMAEGQGAGPAARSGSGSGGELSMPDGTLLFDDTEKRTSGQSRSKDTWRTPGAPKIHFPRMIAHLVPVQFRMSDISDTDARVAGTSSNSEIDIALFRDQIDAERDDDGEVTISQRKAASATGAQQTLAVDTVREELIAAMVRFDEVPRERESLRGAGRVVDEFLAGAGQTDETGTWGSMRLMHAKETLRKVVRAAIDKRQREERYEFEAVTLPAEPQSIDMTVARNINDGGDFQRYLPYTGWARHVMEYAAFDAESTEWKIAQILDRDKKNIAWWLRLDRSDVWIGSTAGRYYPDFIAIDTSGELWVIEGKANRDANDPDVQTKKAAAERWVRAVADNGDWGRWRYLFATEADIGRSGDTWQGLVAASGGR